MKSKTLPIRFLFTSLIYIFFFPLSNAAIHQPQLQIPRIKTAPVIDGKLNDAAWQKSTELSEFINWSLDSYIRDAVTVSLCYDEKNLYVAFRNTDPEAGNLNKAVSPKGPWDTFLWGRNHVSVGIVNKDISVRMMADPKGTQTDWKNDDIAWNGNWKYAASINENDWTAEYCIPLSEFGMNGIADNTDLTISLSRSYPHGESSSWSGKCRLSGQNIALVQYTRWPDPMPGKNFLSLRAQNTGSENLKVSVELELIPLKEKPEFINQSGQGPSSDLQLKINSEPLSYKFDYTVPPAGSINEKVTYDLPSEGSYYASVIVRSKDGTIIRRSVDYWFTIEPNRQKLTDLKNRIGESIAAVARLSNPLAISFRTEADSILASLKRIEKNADEYWNSGKWDDLTSLIERKDAEISQHIHKMRWTALHDWKREDGFGISTAHSVLKLRRDEMFPLPLNDQFKISLACNEYESFQLAILPFGKKLEQLSVEISDMTDNKGDIIQRKNIEAALVGYNKIDWQADYIANKGWHPDPLIPLKTEIDIDGNDVCRPVWITVYAPDGTKPGDYKGTITVKARGMKSVTAEISCRVWDFSLPVESHLKTHSWDEIEYLRDFYNLEEFPVEWYQRFCDLLLKHRFNPGSAGVNYVSQTPDSKGEYDFSKVEKVLDYCIKRGLNRFSIIQMKKGLYTPEDAEKAFKFVEAYTRFLKSKGWLDKALVELWDEPTDLEWPYIRERAERLKKIDPDLRLQLFAEGGPYDFFDKSTDKYGLNKLVNIWAPVNIIESPETQAKGGEIWTYFCTLARENAPNFFIDCPAIYQRSIAWYCWMYGVDGFEHWSSNYFWRNVKEGKPLSEKWPNIPWDSRTYYYFNGEGQLLYPGPDGVPYSSIRLENFRDGMDDYEYLFRLKDLLGKYKDSDGDSRLNEYRQLLNPEEYLLYKYPRKIKVTLENTLRYPDQPERILNTREKIALAIEDLQKRK
ncbi:MAG: DUF4091 domain-containing protein [Bacteroidales bacterium]|nr:DUF4091 domain-containing protein [Bacteroidales bacterium]